jgi:hypothetical protein
MSIPTFVPSRKTVRRFTLTDAIKARKALRFAKRHRPLSSIQGMRLAKADRSIVATFCLA